MSTHTFQLWPVNGDGVPLEEATIYCNKTAMSSSGDTHTALLMPDNKGKCVYFYMYPFGLGCVCNDDFTGINNDPLNAVWRLNETFTTPPYIYDNKARITGDDSTVLAVQNECAMSQDYDVRCEVYPVDFLIAGSSDLYFDSGLEVGAYGEASPGVSIVVNYIQSPTDEWYITAYDESYNVLADTTISEPSVVYLRIVREDDDHTCYYRLDSEDSWVTHGTVNDSTRYNYGRLQSYFDDSSAIADFDNFEMAVGCNDLCYYEDRFNLDDGEPPDELKWDFYPDKDTFPTYIYDEKWSNRADTSIYYAWITSKGVFWSDFDVQITHYPVDVTWSSEPLSRFIVGEFYASTEFDPQADERFRIFYHRYKTSESVYVDEIKTMYGGWDSGANQPTYGTTVSSTTLGSAPTQIDFRIKKNGNNYTSYYKLDGDSSWIEHGTYNTTTSYKFLGTGSQLRVVDLQYDIDDFLITGCSIQPIITTTTSTSTTSTTTTTV